MVDAFVFVEVYDFIAYDLQALGILEESGYILKLDALNRKIGHAAQIGEKFLSVFLFHCFYFVFVYFLVFR